MTKNLQFTILGFFLVCVSALQAQTYVTSTSFENYLETHDASGNSVSIGDPNALGNGTLNDHLVVTSRVATVTQLIINDLNIDDLTELSIKNNNNSAISISNFDIRNNYGLTCVEVSDVTYATNNLTLIKHTTIL